MVVNDTKISQKMKKISWLNIKKQYYGMKKKRLIIIIKNYSYNDLEKSFDGEQVKAEYQDILKNQF